MNEIELLEDTLRNLMPVDWQVNQGENYENHRSQSISGESVYIR